MFLEFAFSSCRQEERFLHAFFAIMVVSKRILVLCERSAMEKHLQIRIFEIKKVDTATTTRVIYLL